MFVGPALVILAVFLIYPVINTVMISLRDSRSQGFVGLENYGFVFTDSSMLPRAAQHARLGGDRPAASR